MRAYPKWMQARGKREIGEFIKYLILSQQIGHCW